MNITLTVIGVTKEFYCRLQHIVSLSSDGKSSPYAGLQDMIHI
jgi:hypothetical protein